MVREFGRLDAAELALSFDPGRGPMGLAGPVPARRRDARRGRADRRPERGRVDRRSAPYRVVRFPGATWSSSAAGPLGLVAANSRAQLEAAALAAPGPRSPAADRVGVGWSGSTRRRAHLDLAAGRRWAEAARATGCQSLAGRVRLLRATAPRLVGRSVRGGCARSSRPIDPDWLDAIPARGPLAAVGFRVDPRAEAWTRLFDLLDRVERVDPERAKMAPSRLRLALAARAAGVRLEADVLPHLDGVAGWVGVADGPVDRALVALYLDDEEPPAGLVAGVKGRRVPDGPTR